MKLRGTIVGCGVVLLLRMLAGGSAAAHAADLPTAVVPLKVNGASIGDVPVTIAGDDILIRVSDLERAGATGIVWERTKLAAGRARPGTTLQGAEAVWLNSLEPLVTHVFDPATLELVLTFDPHLLGSTVMSADSLRPTDIVYTSDTSTFLNYAVSSYRLRRPSLFGEIGRSFNRNLLYTTFSSGPGEPLRRGVTNLLRDDPKHLRRWTLGDSVTASNDVLGGSAAIGGVTVARNFTLDPYFVRQPTMQLRGTATVPSTVDVYVNGMLVSHRDVQPGQFDLRGVPLMTGAGDVQMVVRDPFGGQHVQTMSYYSSASVLAKGLSEFSYSAGKLRESFTGSGSDYGAAAVLGQHRVGVTDSLTAGGRFEWTQHLWSAGPSASFRTLLGDFGAAVGASSEEGLRGTAANFEYRYISRRAAFGAAVQRLSDHYSNVSLPAGRDRATLDASVSAGSSWRRISSSLQWGLSRFRDAGDSRTISLVTSFPLLRAVSGYGVASRVVQNGVSRREFAIGVNIYAGRNLSANVSAARRGDSSEATVDVQRPLLPGTGYGYRFRTTTAGGTESGDAALQYQSSFGRYELGLDPYHTRNSGSVTASGGLVYQGRRLVLTPPVDNSFALIRVPGVPGVRVYSANQLIGRTDAAGDVFVANLLPYYGNAIRIDDRDIPIRYDIQSIERVVAPPFRGGALVSFPVVKIQSVIGSLSIKSGTAIEVPAYGQVTFTAGGRKTVSPIGRDGQFYLENLAAGRYAATVEWEDGRCSFDVSVPEGKDAVVNLGRITCVRDAR